MSASPCCQILMVGVSPDEFAPSKTLIVGVHRHIEADTLDTPSALTATRHTGQVKTVSQLLSPVASEEVVTARFLGLSR